MTTFAVTVTYGNRFHLLNQVIDSALAEGISKVIVVDNNSVSESREKLKAYEKELNGKIKVLYLDDNYGSAGGFKRGFEEAYNDEECEYILALDDDNYVLDNTINKLKLILTYLQEDKNIMLGLYRKIWDWDRKSVYNGWIKSYEKNNFFGLNFMIALKAKFFKETKVNNNLIFPLQPALVTSMGGLFFHKDIISRIGYPKEDFIVYADDHEFTYRFSKNGGHIYMCYNIPIEDLDQTYSDSNSVPHFFDKNFSEFKMFYTVRNYVYFTKSNFCKNKLFFYFNMTMYLLIQFKNILKIDFKLFYRRYSLLLRAIKDGLNGNLGRTF